MPQPIRLHLFGESVVAEGCLSLAQKGLGIAIVFEPFNLEDSGLLRELRVLLFKRLLHFAHLGQKDPGLIIYKDVPVKRRGQRGG
jgi:hypothetical protein